MPLGKRIALIILKKSLLETFAKMGTNHGHSAQANRATFRFSGAFLKRRAFKFLVKGVIPAQTEKSYLNCIVIDIIDKFLCDSVKHQ